ncbi:hypothetical protein BWK59_06160 [Flavobacterium davisii]|uniref:Uncharacterized protein n=1 Tax=Flavobacterium davisii TaxID=2906077 RepID=A0A246GJ81_9FLAO|nr:hypothetical protein [Flavobacterium davisii]OWP84293.1 hypothetical protein BWK59_06160 [Flavobacterium davisii]
MIVTIKSEVFSDSKNNSDLNDLMHFFRKGKHRMHLRKASDFDAFDNSQWKRQLSRSDIDVLKEGIGRIDKKEIIVSQLSDNTKFNIKEAYHFLNQNLRIILEQEEYEKPFILKIIEHFDSSDELISALQNGFLEFYNGAGSNSESILRTRITRDSSTNKNFSAQLNKYLRFFELKDSDREYCLNCDEYPESKSRFLKDNKIPHHILYKREKENYMPDRIFDSFLQTAKKNDKKKEFATYYLKLTHPQKDFLDIEKGFSKRVINGREIKDRGSLSSEVQQLYKSLSDEEYRKIGLGLEMSNFKSDFSNYFNQVSREDLLKRIKHQPKLTSRVNSDDKTERNEFEHIIHEIKYLL